MGRALQGQQPINVRIGYVYPRRPSDCSDIVGVICGDVRVPHSSQVIKRATN